MASDTEMQDAERRHAALVRTIKRMEAPRAAGVVATPSRDDIHDRVQDRAFFQVADDEVAAGK